MKAKVIDVCAVITTFEPCEAVIENIQGLLKQVGAIVIVNDSGHKSLSLECINLENVYILNNENNFGIAKSLNIGIEFADKLNFKYILTLDDDSFINQGYVSKLYDFLRNKANKACLVCGTYELNNKSNKNLAKKKEVVITSGSLFHIESFHAVNGFTEKMFIDYVDFDFCLRLLRRTDLFIYEIPSATFKHKIGESEHESTFLGFSSFDHSAFRIYYQVRNLIYMIKSFSFSNPLLVLYISRNLILLPVKIILFDSNKYEKLKLFNKGFRHGCLGTLGKLS